MKSNQVQSIDPDFSGCYSDLQVMRSAAGYYVGTVFHNPEGYDEPGSRDSGYYKTHQEAERALQRMKNGTLNPRERP